MIITQVFARHSETRLLDYLVNGFTNHLKNWYGAMPHVTKHTLKVSTRPVKPYACESSREKRQQDGQTDTQTDSPKPLFSTFWGLYIPNPVLSRSRTF